MGNEPTDPAGGSRRDDGFDDDATDPEFVTIGELARRLPTMPCVQLDDGAWWNDD